MRMSRAVREAWLEMMAFMEDEGEERPPFAPPFLKDGDAVIGQTAAILFHLSPKHGLAPQDEAQRLWIHEIQLTVDDLIGEVHDTHHPVGGGLYYEDQKPEAMRRSEGFRKRRIPKYLSWLENILRRNPKGSAHLAGDSLTYADLSLFQVVEGLSYSFPRAMERVLPSAPHVAALHRAVAERPRIKTYLASNRRLPFNEEGIFRRYPELDG